MTLHHKLSGILCVCALSAVALVRTRLMAEERPIVPIGVIAPLSGGSADRGEEIVRTLKLFESFYLQKGTRYRYRFILEDGKGGLGNFATTAARKLIDVDKVPAIIAGFSGETIQAGMLGEKAGVVVIGVLASAPEIRNLGGYVYRTYIDIKRGLELLLSPLAATHTKTAIISEEAPFTLSIQTIVKEILADDIIVEETFTADSADFRSLLLRVRAAAPGAIYLNSASPTTFIPLMRQLKELGLEQALYSYFMPAEPPVLRAVGPIMTNIKFIDTPAFTGVLRQILLHL